MNKNTNVFLILEAVFHSLFMRSIIAEVAQDIEKATSKKIHLPPFKDTKGELVEYAQYEKQMKQALGSLAEIDFIDKKILRSFLVEMAENLRVRQYEKKKKEGQTEEYDIEKDKLKNINRDVLGKILISMAKEELEKSGTVPEEGKLLLIYENRFGEYLKARDIFDLNVLARQNQIIAQTAREKQIENIIRLTEAFNKFLEAKLREKEERTRNFFRERLEKMVG